MSEPRQIIRLSSHLLERYEFCKRFFNFTTNLNYGPKIESAPLSLGRFIHMLLARYYGAMLHNQMKGEDTESNRLEAMREVTMIAEAQWAIEHELPYEDMEKGINAFRDYVNYYLDEEKEILDVEQLLSKILFEDEKNVILWEGTPDLIYKNTLGNVFVEDHKSESAKRPVQGLDNQIVGYCWLANTDILYRNAIGLQKTLSPPEKFYRQMLSINKEVINDWVEDVTETAKRIIMSYRRNKWPGSLSQCEHFNHKKACMFLSPVCSTGKSNWEWALENEFKKVEGVYY